MFKGGQTLDLGERSHHYCLLILARQRLSDAQRGIAASAQGWLERQQLARLSRENSSCRVSLAN